MPTAAIAIARGRVPMRNKAAFSGADLDAIVFNATGCGAFLAEYATLSAGGAGDDSPCELALPARELTAFRAAQDWPDDLRFRPLASRVAMHEPCSHRNVLKDQGAVYGLLEKIPGLEVTPLPGNAMYCGAGGTRMLTHPEMALPLRDEKVAALAEAGVVLLVSTNLIRALHLASGIREHGHAVDVMHPAELLARQLIV